MAKKPILFLDFDGVICDSYVECFSSSWYAYHHLYLGRPVDKMTVADKAEFRRMRPMVRNSEDNVVIQHIIENSIDISTQEDFDRICTGLGTEFLEELRTRFYEARDYFLSEHRDFWLGMNIIFPPLLEPLRGAAGNPAVLILSTKKPAFIDEILKYNGISWKISRILEARKRSKEDIILEAIDAAGAETAVFIDDQIDHLRSDGGGRIACYLAEWGYVSEQGRKDFSVPHINLKQCAEVTAEYSVQ